MTTSPMTYTEEQIALAGTDLYLLKGGSGHPLLVLHGFEGLEGWLTFHEALSSHATVYAPAHPGFHQTPRPTWLDTIQHQAIFYHWFIERERLGPVDLVGMGIGGWIAAQMAVFCPQNLRHVILVGAAGLHPQHSEVLDVFIIPWREVIARCFHDPESCADYQRFYGGEFQEFGGPREAGRTMSIRMCFRPFMYDPALGGMLGKVRTPTLVAWGANDAIIPLECGQLYQQAIPGARLHRIERCGHWAHYEQPQELARLVHEFIARA